MKNPIASNRSAALIFGAAPVILTLIGIVLRIINIYSNFEMETGYYYSSALLVDIMHVFFVLSILAVACLVLVFIKRISLEAVDTEKDPTSKVVLCFLVIAALVYIVAKSYFDVYFAMNSPNKILLHMACIAAMFFLVTLARLNLGVLKERSYLFFLATTVFLSGVYAIPSVFFCIISKTYREYTYLYFDIAVLAVFVFAMIRLVALIVAKKPEADILMKDDLEAIVEGNEDTSDTDPVTESTDEE